MKDIAGSRTTYYSTVREILMKKHPKLFNVLLILALILMTSLAVFLASDILSFASSSIDKKIPGMPDIQDKVMSLLGMANRSELEVVHIGKNSTEARANLSGKENSTLQKKLVNKTNSSRIGYIYPSSGSSDSSSGGSSASITIKNAEKSKSKTHSGSDTSAPNANKSKNQTNITANGQINKPQTNLSTLSRYLRDNAKSNVSQIDKLKVNQSIQTTRSPSTEGRNTSTFSGKSSVSMMFDKSPADPKSGSLVDNKAQADLSTISHAVEESKSNPDRDIANKASSIKLEFKNVNSEKVPSNVPTKLANFPSSPAAQNDAVATSSTDSTVAKENAGKTAQTNSAITPTKSENRAQSAREKQAANRKKAADMKRQSRPSRS